MARERLQKYIANCGYCSRRKAELLIEAGLVEVDGTVVRELGAKIDPSRQGVRIHGEDILPPSRRVVALHTPAGFITSTHDTHDRLTVMDLLPRRIAETGVLPAGRLDLETEGLLILTNDGDLQHRITHPRYECVKACPFGAMRVDPHTGHVFKCDLCEGDPECAKWCPTGALQFVDTKTIGTLSSAGKV